MEIPTREYLFGSIFLLSNKVQSLGDGYLEEIRQGDKFTVVGS